MGHQGTPARQPPVQVTLTCQHEASFIAPAPRKGDIVYCRRCGDYRHVLSAEHEYTVKCDSCRLGRRFGQDLGAARLVASRHVVLQPGHTVSVMNGERLQETVATSLEQGMLEL